MRSQAIVYGYLSSSQAAAAAAERNKGKRRDTNHIDFGNRTHTAHHDVDLNRGWWTTEVWSDAVVVTAKKIVQQLADVAVIVALRPLPRGRFCSSSRSETFFKTIDLYISEKCVILRESNRTSRGNSEKEIL